MRDGVLVLHPSQLEALTRPPTARERYYRARHAARYERRYGRPPPKIEGALGIMQGVVFIRSERPQQMVRWSEPCDPADWNIGPLSRVAGSLAPLVGLKQPKVKLPFYRQLEKRRRR